MNRVGWYGQRPKRAFVPPEVIEDTLAVPENTVLMVPHTDENVMPRFVKPMDKKRDWFPQHAYFCLPLVFANLHGYVVEAPFPFVIRWNGSNALDGIKVHRLEDPPPGLAGLKLESHFGYGIFTVQIGVTFRTPENINLMVKAPPNYCKEGLSWLDAVVETDNLRRDFTFNIRVTHPHKDILFEKGDPLGCVLPYPRYFLDPFRLEVLKDPAELEKARKTAHYFGEERTQFDQGYPGLRYMEGEDIYGQKFRHHQKTLDGGAWWRSVLENPNGDEAADPGPVLETALNAEPKVPE